MNFKKYTFAFMLSCTSFSLVQAQQKPENIDAKVEELLSKMTLEEKVGQMTQITIDVITKGKDRYSSEEPIALDIEKTKRALIDYHIGSVLNTAGGKARTPQLWNTLIKGIQDVATKDTRLHIPVIYGVDEIHGATYTAGATMFPQEIAQGAARNPEMVRKAAEITAYETRACDIPWTFSPVLDLGMDPRFPRMWESFGEDPYLCSVMGVEAIKGYEGDHGNVADANHVASSLKHFLGYHAATSGKDRTPAYIPTSALYEYHLPSFKAAIAQGAHSIMINSGIINGVPVHANYKILTSLLKDSLGFKGVAVTDWADIENLNRRDHMAATNEEAIKMAINAGIDMSMVPYNYEAFYDGLLSLVKKGDVKESRIDDAVRRILRLKFELNLFKKPNTNLKDYPDFASKAHANVSYKIASEAITLLKNTDHILPLSKHAKVLVTGPNANSMRTLDGAWTYSWQGDKVPEFTAQYNTILEAIQNKIGKENVSYVPGVSYVENGKYYEDKFDDLEQAVAAAKKADVVLLCVGENSYAEKPGDLNDLYLSDRQTELAKQIAATGTPVILVLNEGRPRIISKFERDIKGIVQIYLPGNYGGDALADILFGDINPSGKLPYTYPRYPNATINYIHKPSEEQKKAEGVYNYEADYNPQYRFGFGLSYSTFKFSNLTLSADNISRNDDLKISVKVENTGSREGKEVVELFTSDLFASKITPDVKRLRRFEKINLKPGESKIVSFTIKPEELSYYDNDGNKILEPGDFEVHINNLTKKFSLN
ncbi:glycoside hydrolase family 3 N-terminal domain-containing protein [Zhouia sp. PK063]|uniref:glycoside hydrolase family 3 N-terminal domain-containing protein n=1 Tax=Zhouia sp. PK063 TaxID=3373602 RepID=UPI0037AD3A35